jgi:hypothetical protein
MKRNSNADREDLADEWAEEITARAEETISKLANIKLEDLGDEKQLSDKTRDECSEFYDRSLEDFHERLSKVGTKSLNQKKVESIAEDFFGKMTNEKSAKEKIASSYSEKLGLVEAFLGGLHDALMAIYLSE